MKTPIKAYTVHLSANAYAQREENLLCDPYHYFALHPYEKKTVKEPALVRELIDLAKENGVNTIVFAVLDALRYESHPELALPDAWSKEELKNEIEYARSLDMEVIPMLNFSAAHNVWMGKYARMISSSVYNQVCADLIDELCELFQKPSLFHLGMEDEYGNRQKFNDYQTVRGGALLAKDLTFLFECCRKNGARPWIYNDFHFSHPALFEATVPKDVVLSPSRIGDFIIKDGKSHQPTVQSMLDTLAMGYDVMLTVTSWSCTMTQNYIFNAVKKLYPPERFFGFWVFPLLPCRQLYRYKLIYEILRFKNNLENYQKEGEAK